MSPAKKFRPVRDTPASFDRPHERLDVTVARHRGRERPPELGATEARLHGGRRALRSGNSVNRMDRFTA